MFENLKQLVCKHTYDLYIADYDDPTKINSAIGELARAGFGLASVKSEGGFHIRVTHAECRHCGKTIHFASVTFNP